MAENIFVRYGRKFPDHPVIKRMLSAEQFATVQPKMRKAIKNNEPLGPKDFEMDSWFPPIDGDTHY